MVYRLGGCWGDGAVAFCINCICVAGFKRRGLLRITATLWGKLGGVYHSNSCTLPLSDTFLDVEKGDILRHWKFSVIFCWCKSWVVGRKCGIWSAVSFFMSCLFLVGFREKTVIRIETCTEIRRNEDQWRGTNRNK